MPSYAKNISGGNEHFWYEEAKDDSLGDINMDHISELEITPEMKIDDMVSHWGALEKNQILTREQNKSFKYSNKFQNPQRISQNSQKVSSSVKKSGKRRSRHRIKKIDLSGLKSKEYIKTAFKRKNSFGIKGKIIRNFYQQLSASDSWSNYLNNKQKVLELFKVEGKGGVIEIKGEPIFPLKMTLDYLMPTFQDCQVSITSMKSGEPKGKFVTPTKRVFKESKNFNNFASTTSIPQSIEVEGKMTEGMDEEKDFKHQFEIENNLITRLTVIS